MSTNYPASLDTDASLFELSNNAKTYLNGDLSSSGGNNGQSSSIDVVDGSSFPITAAYVLVGQELIYYTTRTANKLSGITRAYGGTTAALHRSGSLVKMVVMAEHHNNLKDAIVALETKLGAAGAENYAKRFKQATDPSLVSANNVLDGDLWINTGDGQAYMMVGGTWKTLA